MVTENCTNYKDILSNIFELLDKGDCIENAIKKTLDKYGKRNLESYVVSGNEYKVTKIELRFKLDPKKVKIVTMSKSQYLTRKMKKSAEI